MSGLCIQSGNLSALFTQMNVFVSLSQLKQIKPYNTIFTALLKHESLSTFYFVPLGKVSVPLFSHQKYVRGNFWKTLKEGKHNICLS